MLCACACLSLRQGNLGLTGEYSDALRTLGYTLEDCAGVERNAGLGNGGLGRLAACFLDSIATLDLPAWGYGLRYKYGLFKQGIDPKTGQQVEFADDWLEVGNPWEVKRETRHKVSFYGKVVDGKWVPGQTIDAVAYDSPIPGYKTKNCISLRLWDAEVSPKDFDLAAFNAGDYEKSMAETNLAQTLCAVLYPGEDDDCPRTDGVHLLALIVHALPVSSLLVLLFNGVFITYIYIYLFFYATERVSRYAKAMEPARVSACV